MEIKKPKSSEYDARYEKYMRLIPEVDPIGALKGQIAATNDLLHALKDEALDAPFAAGEWTAREILGHILDSERIFGYRLLCFARGDQALLEVADQDLYVRNSELTRYRFSDLIEEFNLVRKAHILLIEHLPAAGWERWGKVGGLAISTRAIAHLMLGHERHHLLTIRGQYL